MARVRRILSLLLCLLSVLAFAQYKAGKVIFKNPGPYNQASLEAASGLRPGTSFSADGMQKAAQQLMDTGLFDDVQVAMAGAYSNLTVTVMLKPVDDAHLLPVVFSNFVWWDDAALASAVHEKVPLFRGRLAEAGDQQQAVQDALQALIAAKGIAAPIVSHAIAEPSTARPTRTIVYTLVSPGVRIHAVTVNNVTPELRGEEDKAIAKLANAPYSEAALAAALNAPYQNAGYFSAHLVHVQPSATITSGDVEVDVTADVQPGDVFRVSGISFAGTPLMSSEDFLKTAKIHPDDLLSLKALGDTLAPLDAAYHRQGYLDVVVNAVPQLDEATHHVAYTVQVTPGAQYLLHSITPINLPPQNLSAFQSSFKLKPGDPYDESYVKTYLLSMRAAQHQTALPSAYKAVADPNTHLVDLTITFTAAY